MRERPIWIGIVEDDDSVRASLQALLEIYRYQVVAFSSAEELLHPMLVDHCACLILDVDLPGADGFALLNRLRSVGCDKPAIFMTSDARGARAEQAARLRTEILSKPVPAQLLLQKIAFLVGK